MHVFVLVFTLIIIKQLANVKRNSCQKPCSCSNQSTLTQQQFKWHRNIQNIPQSIELLVRKMVQTLLMDNYMILFLLWKMTMVKILLQVLHLANIYVCVYIYSYILKCNR